MNSLFHIVSPLFLDESKEARKELSNSFCAVAELYMTDLCDKEEAEAECSRSV